MVYHLAAAVGVELIVESPVRTIETNVHCTEVVLTQANKKKKPVFIASTSEVYGKSTDAAVPRGRRPAAGPDQHRPLGLRLLEGDRRVPRACLLEGARAARRGRPPVQHRGPAPDRAATGWLCPTFVRQALARPADHGLRRRHPAALLLPRAGRRARAGRSDGRGRRLRAGVQHRRPPRRSRSWSWRDRVATPSGPSPRSQLVPYEEAYEAGFEDMPRRIPDTTKIERLAGLGARRETSTRFSTM